MQAQSTIRLRFPCYGFLALPHASMHACRHTQPVDTTRAVSTMFETRCHQTMTAQARRCATPSWTGWPGRAWDKRVPGAHTGPDPDSEPIDDACSIVHALAVAAETRHRHIVRCHAFATLRTSSTMPHAVTFVFIVGGKAGEKAHSDTKAAWMAMAEGRHAGNSANTSPSYTRYCRPHQEYNQPVQGIQS